VTESGLKLMSWLVGAALVTAMLAVPQAVDPWELPSLVLDRAAVADAIRFDRALAAEVPDNEEARTLRSFFLDHGRAEANPPYPAREYDRRQAEIHHATQALLESAGPSALDAMRAHAVETLMALRERSPDPDDDEVTGILGGFGEIENRYGLIDGDVVVAPELTVRALYKARWNVIHRRPFLDGFSAIERQAYWGWLALHGWGQSLERREEALIAFRDAGGHGVDEAAALFDLLAGNADRAAASLQSLYSKTGELRLRNTALGAFHAALLQARASR
jgi:hypothetical protein